VLRVDPASSIERMHMTAFGATSLFTVAPAKVGNPPERTPGTGIKRQILSTSWERSLGQTTPFAVVAAALAMCGRASAPAAMRLAELRTPRR